MDNINKSHSYSSRKIQKKLTNGLWTTLTWFLIAIIMIPILFLILTSFRSRVDITTSTSSLLPDVWQFENYPNMWKTFNLVPSSQTV